MPNQRAPGVRLRNVALHDELWQAVRDRAKADDVRLVDVVRSALAEYLTHTEGGPNE